MRLSVIPEIPKWVAVKELKLSYHSGLHSNQHGFFNAVA